MPIKLPPSPQEEHLKHSKKRTKWIAPSSWAYRTICGIASEEGFLLLVTRNRIMETYFFSLWKNGHMIEGDLVDSETGAKLRASRALRDHIRESKGEL